MDSERCLQMGKVVGVHGIKGWLKVQSFAESAEPFRAGRRVGVRHSGAGMATYMVRDVRPHKNLLRLALESVETRDAAEALVGAELLIDRAELPEPEEDHWYWCDLIGLSVYEAEVYIGRVQTIFATGSNDVLVVARGDSERLIPAIESVVRRIDLGNKLIQVELPEGL